MIRDLLEESDKSILLLGEPGSGKQFLLPLIYAFSTYNTFTYMLQERQLLSGILPKSFHRRRIRSLLIHLMK